ncbi:MAG: hypothetical protein JOZ15_02315, partial [Acidobacteria bacterium]|nr:hypothetical protein [Acidobacteriota bacterium]
PERCAEEILGNTDGLAIFAGALEALQAGQAQAAKRPRQPQQASAAGTAPLPRRLARLEEVAP